MRHRVASLLKHLVPLLWGNWIALTGTTITTAAGNAILVALIVDMAGGLSNPYITGIAFLVMPGLFVLGLGLLALGAWYGRTHTRQSTAFDQAFDLIARDTSARRRAIFVIVATVVNITLVSMVAYKGIAYSDTATFCGQVCHTVMKPEYTAYLGSPHARVPCADCHIGAGASWFARSKLTGLRQVWATMAHTYQRPIPSPVYALRPARETCEQCHWPAKFHGTRLVVRHHFAEDKDNTRKTNVVQLKIGGKEGRTGRFKGIHWHVSPDVEVRYEALDDKRAKIGSVTVLEGGKVVRVYSAPDNGDKASGKVFENRRMDCVDCHNRPTHIYDPNPGIAMDKALASGRISQSLPEIRKEGAKLLEDVTVAHEDADAHFTEALEQFYSSHYPETAAKQHSDVVQAGQALAGIYRRNIFPEMRVTWGTHPNHLGHKTTNQGCFRCHDDQHATKDGKLIPQDCDLCHEVLAEDETKPELPASLLENESM